MTKNVNTYEIENQYELKTFCCYFVASFVKDKLVIRLCVNKLIK